MTLTLFPSLLLAAFALQAPAAARPRLALTYVGNSGVLVASGDTKILIDALFQALPTNTAYRAPAAETIHASRIVTDGSTRMARRTGTQAANAAADTSAAMIAT